MASIRSQLTGNGVIRVENKGDVYNVTLPAVLQIPEATLDNYEDLKQWFETHQINPLAVMHKGLAQWIIDIRAESKKENPDYESKKPGLLPRPGKSAAEKALEAMSEAELQAFLKRKGII